jgi:hypothetical protein
MIIHLSCLAHFFFYFSTEEEEKVGDDRRAKCRRPWSRLSFIFFCFPVLAICIRIYAERCCEMSQPRKFLRIIVVFRHRKSGVNAEMFSYSLYDYTSIITYTAHTFRVIYWYSRRVYYNTASRSRTGNHLVTQKR